MCNIIFIFHNQISSIIWAQYSCPLRLRDWATVILHRLRSSPWLIKQKSGSYLGNSAKFDTKIIINHQLDTYFKRLKMHFEPYIILRKARAEIPLRCMIFPRWSHTGRHLRGLSMCSSGHLRKCTIIKQSEGLTHLGRKLLCVQDALKMSSSFPARSLHLHSSSCYRDSGRLCIQDDMHTLP